MTKYTDSKVQGRHRSGLYFCTYVYATGLGRRTDTCDTNRRYQIVPGRMLSINIQPICAAGIRHLKFYKGIDLVL